MLTEEIIELIISHSCMQRMCISTQSEIIDMFEEILRYVKEDKPYANVSELFDE